MYTIRSRGNVMLCEIPVEQYQATLERCAEDLLWEAGIDCPPVDALRMAERLGMVVTSDAAMPGRARYVRKPTTAGSCQTISLRSESRSERQHFAAAHEVGEANAFRIYDMLGVDPREVDHSSRERVADAIAVRTLVPRRWLLGCWRDADGDLFRLKQLFSTASFEVIARRLLEVVESPLIVTLSDNGRINWRRWNRSGHAPPPVRLETDCQRRAHTQAVPAWACGFDEPGSLAGSPIDRVRSWPIHEPGWRREITLTEIREADASWDLGGWDLGSEVA